MKQNKIPCMNSANPKFIKKGCPKECFDIKTGDGCPKWKEYWNEPLNQPRVLMISGCIEDLKEHWAFEKVRLLETLIKTDESLRDGMIEVGADGNAYPKPTIGMLELVAGLSGKKIGYNTT